eukprot:4712077-Amphidinium_carterae.1
MKGKPRFFCKLRLEMLSVVGNRPRLYIVGVKKSMVRRNFSFPEVSSRVSLASVLDLKLRDPAGLESLNATGRRNVEAARLKWTAKLGPIEKKIIAVDVGASPSRENSMRNMLPCLTASRGSTGGPLILPLNRQLTLQELARCQGFRLENMCWDSLSERQLGHALGNAMT